MDAGEDVRKAARMLAPEVSARAEEGEELGAMPADLVERLKAARLFVMWQPRALGGLEVDLLTVGRTPTRSSRSGS